MYLHINKTVITIRLAGIVFAHFNRSVRQRYTQGEQKRNGERKLSAQGSNLSL
jgi:hypothetical protein